ncbi:MAG TPA: DUF1501 domain-containing protein, partial [Kineosporiaceae bacterium]|nr:DUF1501 domain-containing protein [Kineosporiaceae bacterium]
TRRDLLALTGAGGGLGLLGATFGDARLAFAAPVPAGTAAATDTLVLITLRGGLDGLSVVAPVGDPGYAQARPNIAVPAGSVKKVDALFGLHPALAPIYPLWDAGKIAAVHAVGQAAPTRSHLEAMAELERAAPNSALRSGWIDRMIGSIPGAGPFTAGQVGNPNLPASMAGAHPAFAMGRLDDVKVEVSDSIVPLAGWQQALSLLHRGADRRVAAPLNAAISAVARLTALPPAPGLAETGYPATVLGQSLHDVVRLIRSGLGLRVATVDVDGWDMHENIGRADRGWMVDRLSELAGCLAAFATELGPDLDRVTVVILSEFGRRVAENGSGGADHGHGNVVLVAGGAVQGGKVYGNWPTLAPDKLNDGDLAVTTDVRQVLAEILTKRCGIASTAAVFPGFTAAGLGLVAPRPTG